MTDKASSRASTLAVTFEELGRENAGVAKRLGAEMAARFGPRDESPISILAHDEQGALVGGLNGVTHWRWLYVKHLWVAPAGRGRGLGRDLLARAEAAAQARGCIGAYVDTFGPATAEFYERCGYARFGELQDFPPGHRRTFSSKRLAPA